MVGLYELDYREKAWGNYVEDISRAWKSQNLRHILAKLSLAATIY